MICINFTALLSSHCDGTGDTSPHTTSLVRQRATPLSTNNGSLTFETKALLLASRGGRCSGRSNQPLAGRSTKRYRIDLFHEARLEDRQRCPHERPYADGSASLLAFRQQGESDEPQERKNRRGHDQ